MKEDKVPRRNRIDKMVPAELSIYNAIKEVEKLWASEKLTESIILLEKAKDMVSDVIDDFQMACEKSLEESEKQSKIFDSMRNIDPNKLTEPFTI